MKAQHNIENIFREKLRNIEADPGTNAWSNIKSGLQSGGVGSASSAAPKAAVASSSSWVSTMVAGSLIAVTAVGGYFFFNKQGEKQKVKTEQKQQKVQDLSPAIEVADEKNIITAGDTYDSTKDLTNTDQTETVQERKSEKKKTVKVNSVHTEKKPASNNTEEKTIDEIIAESQAQLEANKKAAEALEKANEEKVAETRAENNNEKAGTKTSSGKLDSVDRSEKESDHSFNLAEKIQFPNVFSPNLDGKNDVFRLKDEYSQQLDNIEMYVYSSSGKVIKQWVGLNGSWDGTNKDGSLAPQGNYFYYAILRKDNKEYPKKGTFNLIR